MLKVVEAPEFIDWLEGLRDRQAVDLILARLRRVSLGHFGDTKSVGDSVYEMRIHRNPGYRLYFLRASDRDGELVVVLLGGTKSRQGRDIRRAKRLADEWRSIDD